MSASESVVCGSLDRARIIGAAAMGVCTAIVGHDATLRGAPGYYYTGDYATDDLAINAALASLGTDGGTVCMEEGDYDIVNSIDLYDDEMWLRGTGRATFINGDGLSTGEHAITVASQDDCIISDLSIQTENGGGKVSHCIFLDNSTDRTLISNVTIVDSDSNGIHIEGVSAADIKIIHCNILGADGHGVYSNMDAVNALYNLMVRDCMITNTGVDGVHLEDNIGAEVFDNTIEFNIGGDGVELLNSDDCMIHDNWFSGTAGYDVNISAANCDRNSVYDNFMEGTGTGCINDVGTDTAVPEFNVTVENTSGNIGRHAVALMLDGVATTVRFGFTMPMRFQELVTAEVVLVPAANGDLRWNALTDWGKICATEAYNLHSDAVGATTTAGLVGSDWECISVAAALNVAALAAGDRVGLEFWRNAVGGSGDTITGTVYVSELRGRYV